MWHSSYSTAAPRGALSGRPRQALAPSSSQVSHAVTRPRVRRSQIVDIPSLFLPSYRHAANRHPPYSLSLPPTSGNPPPHKATPRQVSICTIPCILCDIPSHHSPSHHPISSAQCRPCQQCSFELPFSPGARLEGSSSLHCSAARAKTRRCSGDRVWHAVLRCSVCLLGCLPL